MTVAVLAFFVGTQFGAIKKQIHNLWWTVRHSAADPARHFPSLQEALRDLQRRVPPGAPILVFRAPGFLLDFQRNPVYVMDFPIKISPPPGLPRDKPAEAIADYLRAQGIDHLIFSPELVPDPPPVLSSFHRDLLAIETQLWDLTFAYKTTGDQELMLIDLTQPFSE
jgi:hypothetical protein